MDLNLGLCPVHDRPYEGLCKGCEVIVCPSCVLFGDHKKHDILSFKEGALYLRKAIDNQMYKGFFKKDYSESKILEIKQALLLLEKNKAETIKNIEEMFNGIINVLKQRKDEVITDLIEKFGVEKEKIDNAESDWECKQEICEKLRQFDKDENAAFLLVNSKFIMEGIRKISEPTQFNELNIYNNLDSNLVIDCDKEDEEGKIYSLDDIARGFENYASLLDPKLHSYQS